MSSLLFGQDPHPRAGEGVVVPNELCEEVATDLRDAYALAVGVDPALAGAVFSELREIRRHRLQQETT